MQGLSDSDHDPRTTDWQPAGELEPAADRPCQTDSLADVTRQKEPWPSRSRTRRDVAPRPRPEGGAGPGFSVTQAEVAARKTLSAWLCLAAANVCVVVSGCGPRCETPREDGRRAALGRASSC